MLYILHIASEEGCFVLQMTITIQGLQLVGQYHDRNLAHGEDLAVS